MTEPSPPPDVSTVDTMRPTRGAERIEIIDILRGFAIFGILTVNMAFFNSPQQLRSAGVEWWPGALDRAVSSAIIFLAEGKFYTIFSMLFGLGLAIQMERAETRGVPFVPLYARRLLILLLIGLVHAFFIWWGDILAIYAVLGFALIPFRKCRPKTLLIWTIVLLLIPLLFMGGLTALVQIALLIPEAGGEVKTQIDLAMDGLREGVDESVSAYSHGTVGEIIAQRARDAGKSYSNLPFWGPTILAIFLIGLNLGRQRFFHDVEQRLPLLRRGIGWFLVFGLIGNLLYTVGQRAGPLSPGFFVAMLGWTIGGPALSFFYVSAIVLLVQKPDWRRRLAPLASVGRMALTNYLMHSVICTLLFYSYGLGLYGRVPPSLGLLLTFAIFALQIPLSVWWLRRFRFGPMEWVWRSLTYGKPQPLR